MGARYRYRLAHGGGPGTQVKSSSGAHARARHENTPGGEPPRVRARRCGLAVPTSRGLVARNMPGGRGPCQARGGAHATSRCVFHRQSRGPSLTGFGAFLLGRPIVGTPEDQHRNLTRPRGATPRPRRPGAPCDATIATDRRAVVSWGILSSSGRATRRPRLFWRLPGSKGLAAHG